VTPAPPPSQLERPFGLAAAKNGGLLIAAGKNAVHRISPTGIFEGGVGMPTFNDPQGVATDAEGFVYVADTWNQRVVKLTPDGQIVQELQMPEGGYYAPRDVFVAPDGEVWVANTGRAQIVRYSIGGTVVATWGEQGTNDGQFQEALGVAADGQEVYVADYLNARVQVFTKEGRFVRNWPVAEWQGGPTSDRPGLRLFAGRVYTTAPRQDAILVFSPTGERLSVAKSAALQEPSALTISHEGMLYVVNNAGTVVSASLDRTSPLITGLKRFAPPE
jgi:DNA-binding beta-propeller fold protein YncE